MTPYLSEKVSNGTSCRTVVLRSKKVGMGDRRATVPYMQKTFDLRRRFFAARFDLNFSKCLDCISKSEIHDIGDIFIY